jgi:hypothetical protein
VSVVAGTVRNPSWAADGAHLVYGRVLRPAMTEHLIPTARCDPAFELFLGEPFATELYTIRPDGTDLKRLTNVPGSNAHSTWSSDVSLARMPNFGSRLGRPGGCGVPSSIAISSFKPLRRRPTRYGDVSGDVAGVANPRGTGGDRSAYFKTMQIRTVGTRWVGLAVLARALAQDATPTAESLLGKAISVEKAQDAKAWRFTYREDEEKLPVDKNGKALTPSHRTYDNIMLEGGHYRKLILIEGKPPDAKLQSKIDAEMERERAARRAHPAGTGRHEVRMGDLDQIVRMCDSTITGQELVSGRMAWRVESVPRPSYKPANTEEEKFLSARRVTWFDSQEGVAVKFLEVFLRPAAGFLPGTEIERGLGKHGDAWLNDSLDLRYDVKLYGVVRGQGVTRYRYYDYKRFEVESKIVDQ